MIPHRNRSTRERSHWLVAPLVLALTVAMVPAAGRGANMAFTPQQAAWTDADKEAQRVAGKEIIKRLQKAATDGEKEFTIPPGDYRFGKAEPSWAILSIQDLHDMRITARGATFWFEHWKAGLVLVNAKNIVLDGLTIDFDPLPYTQGVITALEEKTDWPGWGKSWIEFEVDPGFLEVDAIMRDQVLDFVPSANPQLVFNATGDRILLFQHGKPFKVEKTGDRRWRVHVQPRAMPAPALKVFSRYSDYGIKPGDRFVLIHRTANTAVALSGCENVRLEGVTIYSSSGQNFSSMGKAGNAGGNAFVGCVLERRPGTGRLLAGNADGFYSHYEAKGPLIEDCKASFIADDIVNIRSGTGMMLERTGPNEALIAPRFYWEVDNLFLVGTRLTFVDFITGEERGTVAVKEWTPLERQDGIQRRAAVSKKLNTHLWGDRGVWRVTFDSPVPVEDIAYFYYPDFAGKGFIVRNCVATDSLASAMRVQAQGGLVENNRFIRLTNTGLIVSMHFDWMEGAVPKDIVIRGNHFEDIGVNTALPMFAPYSDGHPLFSIKLSQRRSEPLMSGTALERILVEDNTIVRPPGLTFLVANARNVTIRNNRIVAPNAMLSTGGPPDWAHYGAAVHASVPTDGFIMENNRFEETPPGFAGEIIRLDHP